MSFGNPPALALAASFFFGLALVLTQFGLRHMQSGQGALVSIPLLTLIAWTLAPVFLDLRQASGAGLFVFLAVGAAYPALVTVLTYESNRMMGPGIAGALGNIAPLFAVTGAALLLGEWPNLMQSLGIVAILAGAMILTLRGGLATGRSWPTWAPVLPIGASVIRGVAQPVIKIGLAVWPSSFAAVLFGFTASAIVVLILSMVRHRGWPSGFTGRGVFWFGLVGLCNGMAVACLYSALSGGSVSLVAPLAATYPLVTLAISAVALRSEKITTLVVAGTSLTVAGVAMLVWK